MFLRYKTRSQAKEPIRMTNDPGAPMLKTTNFFQFPKSDFSHQKKLSKQEDRDLDEVFYSDNTQAEPMLPEETDSEESEETDDSDFDGETDSDDSTEETETDSSGLEDYVELDSNIDMSSSGIKMPKCDSSTSESDDELKVEDSYKPKKISVINLISSEEEDNVVQSGVKTRHDSSIIAHKKKKTLKKLSSSSEEDSAVQSEVKTRHGSSIIAHKKKKILKKLSSSEEEDSAVQSGVKRKHGSSTIAERKKKTLKKLSSSEDSDDEQVERKISIIEISSDSSSDEGDFLSEESIRHLMSSTPPIVGNPPYNWPWN